MELIKYTKIEVLLIDKNTSINKLTFDNCYHQLTGDFIIISIILKNNDIISEVFNLMSVKTYKLYQ